MADDPLTIDQLPDGEDALPAFDDVLPRRDISAVVEEDYTVKDSYARVLMLGRVASISALKAISILKIKDGQKIDVLGFSTPGDGGGGTFFYSADSVATANAGICVAPNSGSGRWLRVYNGPISVAWFGAVGDGSTDDTTAISNAIAAGTHHSVILFEPKKQYRVTNQINIYGKTNLTLSGYGASITTDSSTNIRKFRFTSCTGGSVRGLRFDGARIMSTPAALGEASVEIYSSSGVIVTDCIFDNLRGGGVVLLANCPRCTIERNLFQDNFCAIFSDDDTVTQPTYFSIVGNTILNNSSSASYSGGIKISGLQQPIYSVISGNTINYAGEMGIEVQGPTDFTVNGNTVEECTYGISISNCQRAVVSNNSLRGQTYCSIEIASGTKHSTISANTIYNATSDAIMHVSSSSHCTYVGNRIQTVAQSCFYAESGPLVLTGNMFSGNSTVYLKSVSNALVSGNHFNGTAGQTFAAVWLDANEVDMTQVCVDGNTFSGSFGNSVFMLYSPNAHHFIDCTIRNNSTNGLDCPAAMINTSSSNPAHMVRFRSFDNVSNSGDDNHKALSPGISWFTSSKAWDEYIYTFLERGVVGVDCTGGAITFQLPAPSHVGAGWRTTIRKVDSGGNAVTITSNGGSLYGGHTTLSAQYDYSTFESDGTNWVCVGKS